jgi:branched-subunit amino acid transport protein
VKYLALMGILKLVEIDAKSAQMEDAKIASKIILEYVKLVILEAIYIKEIVFPSVQILLSQSMEYAMTVWKAVIIVSILLVALTVRKTISRK